MPLTYYDELARGYDRLHGDEQRLKRAILIAHLPNVLGRILDIGCGTGLSFSRKNTIGLDPSIRLLRLAKKRGGLLVQGCGEALPFKDKSFALVQSVSALHNFHDWRLGIAEMRRVSSQWVIISLLKKAKEYKQIRAEILTFASVREIDADRDTLFVCTV
ncbi:methyltransferase domain-containing protein [Candidatus Woesearchaeota archaeon]|nr:methyltransferase domain-containing protein [Candidatus Woesearchaeota archaeon]